MHSVRVPRTQPPGTIHLAVEFDSGPLAGPLRAQTAIEVDRP
jgi:hypothetical protein